MFFLQFIKKKYFIFLYILAFLVLNARAQQEINYSDFVYSETVKTVMLYKKGLQISYPVITLGSDEKLVLEFDDLSSDTKNLNYTYIHCTPDWIPSDLNSLEFIEGFSEGDITEYEYSFNTLKDYNHYVLEFPSEQCRPYLSGNYILLVYEDFDRENPILTRKFRIVEHKVSIETELKRSTIVANSDCCTEFLIKINDISGNITVDIQGTSLYILRNNNEMNSLQNMKPTFVKGNILEYSNSRKMYMEAGNEYRYFNVKNHRYVTDKVANISFIDPYYIFSLYPENDAGNTYSYVQDINGNFVVTSDDTDYPATEADYVLVDFKLRTDNYIRGDVYLYGDFTGENFSDENKLEYNEDNGFYELRKMVKQGFYNYYYVVRDPLSGLVSLQETEGSFYQTENDYIIYFYYKSPSGQYHQLLGYAVINSQKSYK